MNQYIITDEQLQQLLTRTQKNPLGEGHGSKYLSLAGWEISTIVDKVYHHPYNPQAEQRNRKYKCKVDCKHKCVIETPNKNIPYVACLYCSDTGAIWEELRQEGNREQP